MKLGIILIIIFIIFTLPTSLDYIQSMIESNNGSENPNEKFEGLIDVSATTTEAVVLRNIDNIVQFRALGLNPEVKIKIYDIKNGDKQKLTLNMTNISPARSKVYVNNDSIDITLQDIIEEYSIKSTKHSLALKLIVEQDNEFDLRFDNQVDPKNFSYVVLGDTQGRNDIFEYMVPFIKERNPDFVLYCGDLTTMGTTEQFKEFMTVTDKVNSPLFLTPGNHDIKSGIDNYKRLFGALDYSFGFDGYKFFSIDSSKQSLTSKQLSWLENNSMENDKNKILFTHVPLFSNILPEHIYPDLGVPRNLMKILEENDFEYCFSGHLHLFNYTKMVGVKYVTTGGGGGAPYAPEELGGFRHFVVVTVAGTDMTWDVVKFDSELFNEDNLTVAVTGINGTLELSSEDLKTFESISGVSACQNQYGNWVGNGTYTGVDVSALLEFVGEMGVNDTLLVKALDGYYQEFSYANVYLNASWERIQGPLILSYQFDGSEPPVWIEGPRLITMPPDGGYSLEDCKRTSVPDQGYWAYQSAGARWVRNVVNIIVVEKD